jgi:hypothetical protein
MHNLQALLTLLRAATARALLAVGLIVALTACAGAGALGMGGDTWQEEVLLHDGRKMVVERYTLRGGRHEVGQKGDYIAQTMRFTPPGSSKAIEWQDQRSADLGNSSFLPMAVEVVRGTPYIVANTMGCLAYNKWGRPNPPYVVFKHEANTWQRIALTDLPPEVKTPNLVQSMPDLIAAQEPGRFVTAARIAQIVADYRDPKYRTILREAMTEEQINSSCQETFSNGKGRALSANWFKLSKSIAECRRTCQVYEYDSNSCPCSKFFKEE